MVSLPPREAWIEIGVVASFCVITTLLPPREAWIEISAARYLSPPVLSLPPREAWIEIMDTEIELFKSEVASPAGSVD